MRRLLALLLCLPAAAGLAASPVLVEPGELPVILAAPHGGELPVPGCGERGAAGARFVNRPDLRTDRLARGIADELRHLTGRSPYLVIANFHRKYIDANRPPAEAYDGAGCAATYDAYHAALRNQVAEVRARFPHAMLFDLHGQTAFRDAVLRGTRQGRTVQALLARAGATAITGPDSVFGRLAALGYTVVPANNLAPTEPAEAKNYTGGHTVDLYGSHRADGIDAIQLEYGLDLRESAVIDRTARDTAQAIAAFHARFLR